MNFLRFFLVFENVVYRKMFQSYLRIVSTDYPETSEWSAKSFCEDISKFRDLVVFSKLKKNFED